MEAAIVSVQYTDKAGRLNTLRGNADKLLIKRRHRHHPGNWGLMVLQKTMILLKTEHSIVLSKCKIAPINNYY